MEDDLDVAQLLAAVYRRRTARGQAAVRACSAIHTAFGPAIPGLHVIFKFTVNPAQFCTTDEPCALIRHWLFSRLPLPAGTIVICAHAD